MKKIVAHNFSLPFPLASGCLVPFSSNYNKKWVLPRGKNNVRFDFYFENAYVRQSNKSLIVFPYLEIIDAEPKNSYRVKSLLIDKAFKVVKDLQKEFRGLRVLAPKDWRPSTQEYAIEDAYAKSIDFTFKNEIGQIDKSRHKDASGHVFSGGEIDWKSPEFADAYIRMPIVFKESMASFLSAMKYHEINIKSHVKAVRDLSKAAIEIKNTLKKKKKRDFKDSFKKSATYGAVT